MEMYPYCSQCEKELSDEEKMLNKKHKNYFFPVCNACLKKHVDSILNILKENKESK